MDFWIKSIGAARSPLHDEWLRGEVTEDGGLVASHRLAERVHFPLNSRPTGIRVGDHFLLYGVTSLGGRIIGAGIFRSPFCEDDGSSEPGLRSAEDIAEWPWRIDVEMLLSLWHAHRGPTVEAIDVPGAKMRRRSHMRLSEEQYLAGLQALADTARPA